MASNKRYRVARPESSRGARVARPESSKGVIRDRVARPESSKGVIRRQGFTLVEMMVAMALILFIMVILSEAFKAGLDTFRQLKAIGDLEEKLRTATTQLRRDLSADHFEGKRRLSDPFFYNTPTREGFFRIVQASPSQPEGTDSDGNLSYRADTHTLQLTVKLRGNKREGFFKAKLPYPPDPPDPSLISPLLNPNSSGTFFNQPNDGRFQDTIGVYHSAWAEVVYFLVKTGQTAGAQTPLYTLYRAELLAVPDNRNINFDQSRPNTQYQYYTKMSCLPDPQTGKLYFHNPSDLASGKRAFVYPTNLSNRVNYFPWDPTRPLDKQNIDRSDILLTDVISFDVRVLKKNGNQVAADFDDLFEGGLDNPIKVFDSNTSLGNVRSPYPIAAIQIILRVWDRKTEQTRQITIVQDM